MYGHHDNRQVLLFISTTNVLLVEEVKAYAVLASLHHVTVEGRRVPAVARFSLIGLLA